MLCIFNSHKSDTFFIIKHVNSQFLEAFNYII